MRLNRKGVCHRCNACRLIGMNAEMMCQYIEFVADRLLMALGYRKVYNAQ